LRTLPSTTETGSKSELRKIAVKLGTKHLK
jgi:hypothetical protein